MPLDKTALRMQFGAYRAGLSGDEYAARSASIVERMQALPELLDAQTVHCYWPIVARREVDVRPLLAWLRERGIGVVLPVVTMFGRAGAETQRLQHLRLGKPEDLQRNQWGIHEPSNGECVSIEDLNVVIVPALGAGRNGHRVGHGFGYYDEFLDGLHVPTLCPVYDACLVESVPPDAHDVPISVIITESQTLRPLPA